MPHIPPASMFFEVSPGEILDWRRKSILKSPSTRIPPFPGTSDKDQNSIKARFLPTPSQFSNLGPPDIVWVKVSQSTIGGTSDTSFFNFVIGFDINLGALSSYIGQLLIMFPNVVQEIVYCSYNAFSNIDLQVRFASGSITVAALDENGTWISPLSIQLWEETHISALLRSFQTIKIPNCVQYFSTLVSSSDEKAFFALAKKYLKNGKALGCEAGPSTIIVNHLTSFVAQYFFDTQRPDQVVKFFQEAINFSWSVLSMSDSSLQSFITTSLAAPDTFQSPPDQNPSNTSSTQISSDFDFQTRMQFGIYHASSLVHQGKLSESLALLLEIYVRCNRQVDSHFFYTLGSVLLLTKHFESALYFCRLGLASLQPNPQDVREIPFLFHVLHAKILFSLNQFGDSLKALNSIVGVSLESPSYIESDNSGMIRLPQVQYPDYSINFPLLNSYSQIDWETCFTFGSISNIPSSFSKKFKTLTNHVPTTVCPLYNGSFDPLMYLEFSPIPGCVPRSWSRSGQHANMLNNTNRSKHFPYFSGEIATHFFGGVQAFSYQFLVSLKNKLGWDGLLQLRSKVFTMVEDMQETDSEENSSSNNDDNLQEGNDITVEKNITTDPTSPTLDENGVGDDQSESNNTLQSTKDDPKSSNPTVQDTTLTPMSSAEVSESPLGSSKTICQFWLDSVFTGLYHDLVVFKEYDLSLKESISRNVRQWEELLLLCVRLGKVQHAIDACFSAIGAAENAAEHDDLVSYSVKIVSTALETIGLLSPPPKRSFHVIFASASSKHFSFVSHIVLLHLFSHFPHFYPQISKQSNPKEPVSSSSSSSSSINSTDQVIESENESGVTLSTDPDLEDVPNPPITVLSSIAEANSRNYLKAALSVADRLLRCFRSNFNHLPQFVRYSVQCCIYKLVVRHGLDHVRKEAANSIPRKSPLLPVFLDMFHLGVPGFDR